MSSSSGAAHVGEMRNWPTDEETIDLAAEYLLTTFIAAFKPDDTDLQLALQGMRRELHKVDYGKFVAWLEEL